MTSSCDSFRRLTAWALVTGLLSVAGAARAVDNPPFDARTVYLRSDCATLAAPLQTYCFTGTTAMAKLDAWLDAHAETNPAPPAPRTKRDPGPTDPLVVDVGEGRFEGSYLCVATNPEIPDFLRGHITFQGAGRDKSTIVGDINVLSCTEIAYRDLTLGETGQEAHLNVERGSSSWDRIDLIGSWYEEFGCGPYPSTYPPGSPPPTHRWSDSNITTTHTSLDLGEGALRDQLPDQGFAYFAECDQTNFYGGSITLLVGAPITGGVGTRARYAAVAVADQGRFTGYGTHIEARSTAARTQPVNWEYGDVGLIAVITDVWSSFNTLTSTPTVDPVPGGTFELYGGSITVDSTLVAGQNSTAVQSFPAGTTEIVGASYDLHQQPAQIARRLAGEGEIDAPLFHKGSGCSDPWAATQVPGSMRSRRYQDAFVERGCNTAGQCGFGYGTETHFMVYDDVSCPLSNPWYDRTAGHCRTSDPAPSAADDDADGVVNDADNCTCVANPPVTPLSFQHVTGGQLDDDLDGFGNQCDADFDDNGHVDAADDALLSASMGKARSGSDCGTTGTLPCAPFDMNGQTTNISPADLGLFRSSPRTPGPRCDSCPLP